MRELPHFHHGPTPSFLHSQPIENPPSGQGLICAADQMFIWDDPSFTPLSYFIDRSPRAFHSTTHNVVRESCFEVLRASVESIKLFLDGSLCLAGRWPWSGCLGPSSWRQRSALLAIFLRMWGGAIPASACKQGIGVAFKQPVIILRVSFRAISTCQYVRNCLTKNRQIQQSKSKAPMRSSP